MYRWTITITKGLCANKVLYDHMGEEGGVLSICGAVL